MSNLEDKLILEFINLGCSERNAAATYQVYIELCEVRRLFNVRYYFNNIMKRMYITAKKSNSSETTIYLPICSSENLTFHEMQKVFETIKQEEIIFAIITADSSCCYYQLSNDLPSFNSTHSSISMLKTREHHDVQLNLRKTEIETNLCIKVLPPLTEDDGSRPIVGPLSRQWYQNW